MDQQDLDLVALTGGVVAAYVENHTVATTDLPSLIATVHAALSKSVNTTAAEERAQPLVPAVPVKKSVTSDFIVCLPTPRPAQDRR